MFSSRFLLRLTLLQSVFCCASLCASINISENTQKFAEAILRKNNLKYSAISDAVVMDVMAAYYLLNNSDADLQEILQQDASLKDQIVKLSQESRIIRLAKRIDLSPFGGVLWKIDTDLKNDIEKKLSFTENTKVIFPNVKNAIEQLDLQKYFCSETLNDDLSDAIEDCSYHAVEDSAHVLSVSEKMGFPQDRYTKSKKSIFFILTSEYSSPEMKRQFLEKLLECAITESNIINKGSISNTFVFCIPLKSAFSEGDLLGSIVFQNNDSYFTMICSDFEENPPCVTDTIIIPVSIERPKLNKSKLRRLKFNTVFPMRKNNMGSPLNSKILFCKDTSTFSVLPKLIQHRIEPGNTLRKELTTIPLNASCTVDTIPEYIIMTGLLACHRNLPQVGQYISQSLLILDQYLQTLMRMEQKGFEVSQTDISNKREQELQPIQKFIDESSNAAHPVQEIIDELKFFKEVNHDAKLLRDDDILLINQKIEEFRFKEYKAKLESLRTKFGEISKKTEESLITEKNDRKVETEYQESDYKKDLEELNQQETKKAQEEYTKIKHEISFILDEIESLSLSVTEQAQDFDMGSVTTCAEALDKVEQQLKHLTQLSVQKDSCLKRANSLLQTKWGRRKREREKIINRAKIENKEELPQMIAELENVSGRLETLSKRINFQIEQKRSNMQALEKVVSINTSIEKFNVSQKTFADKMAEEKTKIQSILDEYNNNLTDVEALKEKYPFIPYLTPDERKTCERIRETTRAWMESLSDIEKQTDAGKLYIQSQYQILIKQKSEVGVCSKFIAPISTIPAIEETKELENDINSLRKNLEGLLSTISTLLV